MNNFLERLKTDRTLQIIIAIFLILILFLLFFIFRSSSSSKDNCYREKITIWLPFDKRAVLKEFSYLKKYCLTIDIVNKSLEKIDEDLITSLAEGGYPDIVFIDDEILFKNKDKNIFATVTPVFADSLMAFYNEDILNFLNLTKPKTLDELKNFIKKTKDYRQNFTPLILGTKEVRHRKEIILSLMTLNKNYKDKTSFVYNMDNALDIYFSFIDPKSDFFAYSEGKGDDLINFANENTAVYFGFYKDKKDILAVNPRIKLSYEILPLNTFPPKAKIYTKIFYLAQIKKSKAKAKQPIVDWFVKYKLSKFSEQFDLVPFKEINNLPLDKKVNFESVKNFGESFDFIDKRKLFEYFDSVFDFSKDKNERRKIIEKIFYSL